jgi:hypothetical protein
MVERGDHVTLHFTATIDESSRSGEPGKQFNATREALEFKIGIGFEIAGWEKGLIGLCVGSHATLVVPPAMGYGDTGHPNSLDVPGGATLRYDLEILSSLPGPPEQVRDTHITVAAGLRAILLLLVAGAEPVQRAGYQPRQCAGGRRNRRCVLRRPASEGRQ